ncbi:lipid droplet-associated hydrolase-like isoform X1 [Mya arenaria]|uniref:lipid droplet-associated hydrolase-like isoform X1 n=1 Tax=Mya arenaria TaxID=6604 RepID=UPI0022DEB396|nr:lipid droplet-associated hydrolase-like isoform X1 [Mya arenaria]XP_052762495.1 lipid droplet-associated hydrolase-like isoform X1 [Mya arenaria]
MAASRNRWMEFQPILGMPTCLLKYGKVQSDTQTVILVIPGNPGVIEYYDCFMEELYRRLEGRVPVWGVSHAGHVQPPDGNQQLYDKLSYEVCTLEGQIRHKVTFIKENIPANVKLIFIGHSIGCYIILKILDQLDHKIKRCFMLFPTIERMAASPNGRVYTPALKYLRWLAPFLVKGVSYLPENTKRWLIECHFKNEDIPSCTQSATLSFISPFSVSNSLYMAHQEMQAVDKLDVPLLTRHMPILSFYFGSCDGWCPLAYGEELRSRFPTGDIRTCDQGYSHAYVIDASPQMADIVSDWAQPFL